ncbi:MAG: winged helix-turn-helix domain-containing protein [Phycisphaerales bacterium]|nr:winged helix-turn-helix domain-containing protein [Phycisphaerales bacterium]
MKYDEDLLVELIADAELTHAEIAERVGASRQTVWLIANGRSRPDLQQQIADVVQGYRQAAIRTAAKHMQPLLMKQIKIALEGQGETSRKAREFLLKNFMTILADEPAQRVEQHALKRRTQHMIEVDQQYEKRLADEKEVAESLKRELDMKFGPDGEYEDDYEDDYEDESEDEENEENKESPAQPPAAVETTDQSPEPSTPEPPTEQSPPQNPETDFPTKAEFKEFLNNLDTTPPDPYHGEDPIVAYRKRLRAASLEAIASAMEEPLPVKPSRRNL